MPFQRRFVGKREEPLVWRGQRRLFETIDQPIASDDESDNVKAKDHRAYLEEPNVLRSRDWKPFRREFHMPTLIPERRTQDDE